MKNDNFLRALKREKVDRTPIWVMRQAGRYLPEYRATRAKAGDFMTLCKTPELACEVTMQPLARFDLDAAILFSDILTIPDALDLGLYFETGEGPRFERPLVELKQIELLTKDYPGEALSYVTDAISLIKHELADRIPLIGFTGSPWTLACYMVQGQGSKDFAKAKRLLFAEPNHMHLLLEKLSHHISCYLNAQIQAGVDALMIFDTWGGLLDPQSYQLFSLDYMNHILNNLKPAPGKTEVPPAILFTKGGGQWLEKMAYTKASGLGLDWTVDIGAAFRRVGAKVALQGNLDPSVLLATPDVVQQKACAILEQVNHHVGHIFNLGHGITPEVPVENMQALIEAVHGY